MDFTQNFQRFARNQNMFAPTNPIGNDLPSQGGIMGNMQPPSPMGMQQPEQNPLEQYQPDTRATDMLHEMINNIPQRNHPDILHKVMASIAGLGGGPEAADQFAYKPYYQNMQDWNAKLGPVEKLAGEERMANTNMRQVAASLSRDRTTERGLDIKEADEARKSKATDAYVKMQQFKMQNPDWKIVEEKGGTFKLVNPKTGESRDTGIDSGTLSDMDKLNLQIEGQKEVARVPRTTVTSGTTTTITPPTPQPPSQQKTAQYLAAQSLKNKYPDTIGKYINLGNFQDGDFNIVVAPEGKFGSEAPYYIQQLIEEEAKKMGGETGPKTSTSTRSSTSTSTKGATPKATTSNQVAKTESTKSKIVTSSSTDKRAHAIQILQEAKKPVTEANIKHVEDQLK